MHPLQPLCDAVPELAAGETDIPIPPGTGDGSTSPLAPLCAAVPEAQPLCDATSVPPGPGRGEPAPAAVRRGSEAQPLCDATSGHCPTRATTRCATCRPAADLRPARRPAA